ncbi:MAG TPA: hypothetical protein PLV62_09420 [Spirochaetota bacterium]|nr:hypothetical protein [Spirochaetota bacterium]
MSDILAAFVARNTNEIQTNLDNIQECPFPNMMPLIINDGVEIESASELADTGIHFVIHEEPLGYGGALVSALSYARDFSLHYLFIMPVEAFTGWQAIATYVQHFETSDILTGNRLPSSCSAPEGFYGEIVTCLNNGTGLHIVDPLSPVKGIAMKHCDSFEITEFPDTAFLQLSIQARHFHISIKEFQCSYPESLITSQMQDVEDLPNIKDFIAGELYLYPYIQKGH